jgi:hypothetical protein
LIQIFQFSFFLMILSGALNNHYFLPIDS